jgi:hypothetical protein
MAACKSIRMRSEYFRGKVIKTSGAQMKNNKMANKKNVTNNMMTLHSFQKKN